MALTIVLKDFAGPLDLLWHLIKQEKLDIYDIPIAQITGQYLEYLQAMQDNALDVAGDYFVMAASLMALKSRMLLPEPEPEPGTEELVEDPRAELVEQLLNYQVFQEAAGQLRDLEVERSASFAKPASLPPAEVTAPLAPGAVKLIDFQRAVADVVHRVQQQETAVRHIELRPVLPLRTPSPQCSVSYNG
ncbi:segregation and condensation protein A [Lacticaseibacillus pantheris]|uniref:segregation and condensation protein A n=1 Tax=Lacticaseibacillus pantheris TaxID=171523 RepID=UPI000A4C3768|nr:segregation/condensation protein A [Lacticaseibacillus pantheris]